MQETVVVSLICGVCGRVVDIDTQDLTQYTEAVRNNYRCFRCRDTHSSVGKVQREEAKDEKKKEDNATEDTKEDSVEESKETEVSTHPILIDEEQLANILIKLKIPDGWKKELKNRYKAGAKDLPMFLIELDSIIDNKTRVKGDEVKLAKQKETLKAMARKVCIITP